MKMRQQIWLCLLGLAACVESAEPEGTAVDEIVNGSAAPTKTFVTFFRNNCSSVLIHGRYVLTAGHCINFNNHDIGFGESVAVIDSSGHNAGNFRINRAHTFGHLGDSNSPVSFGQEPTGDGGSTDVALVQLIDPIPSSMAGAVEVANNFPANGAAATAFGFGCTDRSQPDTAGQRRSFTYAFGQATRSLCQGDSGGPAVIGDANGFATWGINSGTNGSGNDVFGSAVFFEDKIMSAVYSWEGTTFERGFDRFGFDFSIFDLPLASPDLCRSSCQANDGCRAFTYVQPGVYGPNARCFLKSAIGAWQPCDVCTSGTVLSQEPGIDRNGGDFTSFTAEDNRPEICVAACGRNPTCHAYTFVPRNFSGPGSAPACFLKTTGARRIGNSLTTAGLKRGFEIDYDRDGRDYTFTRTTSADPDACRLACANDARCRAFTFVAPGVTEPMGECHLKSTPGSPVPHVGMTSGMKRGLEVSVDRIGGDLRNFELSSAVPEACQAACSQDGQCQAFTWAPPGYVNGRAHCWLKSSIPPPSFNEALISGMKGTDFF
jgi:V8-like Glu-specific endopeptidase